MGNSTVWEWHVVVLLIKRAAGGELDPEPDAEGFESPFFEAFLRGAIGAMRHIFNGAKRRVAEKRLIFCRLGWKVQKVVTG